MSKEPKTITEVAPNEMNQEFRNEVLNDFKVCCLSREVSLMARREVLTGKAKFGILGDGKEVPQVAMARAFRKGDWRSGYYRDQTFMMALGLCSVEEYFAQLYADPENDPFSGGRQMNAHFGTKTFDNESGEWLNELDHYNVSSDISCTAGQMARALGLALASKHYRQRGEKERGNVVCFATIGDASTSEGAFWETINAAGVMQVPLAVSVWDDGYGISVPKKYQTTKESISEALAGMKSKKAGVGISIKKTRAWDYAHLVEIYTEGIAECRKTHKPLLIHVEECTQPQGHSTSGSHERYKTKDRLNWEQEFDCITRMEQWMHKTGIATAEETTTLRNEAKQEAKDGKNAAWKAFTDRTKAELKTITELYQSAGIPQDRIDSLASLHNPVVHELIMHVRATLRSASLDSSSRSALNTWLDAQMQQGHEFYHTNLYSSSPKAVKNVATINAEIEEAELKNGYEVLNAFFDQALERDQNIVAFGEDVGQIGDVNQGFAGLQEKYGEERVFDAGIREWTIMGQAIGLAMRCFRPIAEIQYLDYLVYGLSPLTDDLATLLYRSNGQQRSPAIIRTRGHRLEGIWHSGSQIGLLLSSLRGMNVCVPRNMTQAAGMYNTLLQADEPAVVVECLNGYRLKEAKPNNLADFTVQLGLAEVLQEGSDITIVTYGSCIRVAEKAITWLADHGVSVELVDAQTLLPFDTEGIILESVKKTSRVIFLDEDVPGGASAYMMQQVLDRDGGYLQLDSKPVCLSAKAHRPPYGSDGDYFTKPQADDVFDAVMKIMREAQPSRFA